MSGTLKKGRALRPFLFPLLRKIQEVSGHTCSFLNREVSQIQKVHVYLNFSIKSMLQPFEPSSLPLFKKRLTNPATKVAALQHLEA